MNSTFYRPNGFPPSRDPGMAALLSLVPGLGQLYNGETRKGYLFLAASCINISIGLMIVFTKQILFTLSSVGHLYKVQPNDLMVKATGEMHVGSALSIMFVGLVLSFVSYAMRDAYDHAVAVRRKRIYPEYEIEMTEAASGSYITHAALIISCFILAFFFLVPPQPKMQVTDIEFIQDQIPTKKIIRSRTKAPNSSITSGKHNPTKPVTTSTSKPASSLSFRRNSATEESRIPRPVMPKPHTPTTMPKPDSSPLARNDKVLPPMPSFSKSSFQTQPGLPQPIVARPGAGTSQTSPTVSKLTLAEGGGAAPSFVPRATSGPGNSFAPTATGPVASGSHYQGAGSNPQPKGVDSSTSPRNDKGVPTPIRAGSGSQIGPSIAPSIGKGEFANPRPNISSDTRPNSEAGGEPNFGPYMQELQRRIKRTWIPPRDAETKRVMVVFKVHTDGSLSHLQIVQSSGSAQADNAALTAVKNASPFANLPKYSPADVDIQFTFDYNVFGGRRQ